MKKEYFELIEVGCLAFMTLYQLLVFFQVKKNYYLILSIICFMVLIRSTVVDFGESFLYLVLPDLSFETGMKIRYLTGYSCIIWLPMFVHSIFNYKFYGRFIVLFQIAGCSWLLLVALSSFEFYKSLEAFAQGILVLAFLFTFRILYVALKRKRTGSLYILFGISFCFLFVSLEILRIANVVDLSYGGPNLVTTGIVIFLFFLTIALSSIFAESFQENVQLNEDLNERVLERTKALSESNIIKERIIRIISHDLRSPLANLKGLVSIAQFDDVPKKMLNENFKKINKGIDKSLGMLDDLLAWASTSAHSDSLKLYFERINLSKLIEHKISLFHDDALDKKITFLNEVDDAPDIYADKNIIKVVLRNLISNALKFTPKKGYIIIRFQEQSQHVIIQVIDTGIGIPANMKNTMFEMKTENNRPGTENEKSTGIGLALVYDLIHQTGGSITVTDNPEIQGAIFSVKVKKWVEKP